MPRKLQVARGEVDLGTLTEAEVLELLHAGYLLPTDQYWAEGMAAWKSLAELKAEPEAEKSPAALMKLAKQTVTSASEAAVSQVARLTNKLRSATGAGKSRLTFSPDQMLDAFAPQIQKLVSSQLVKHSVIRVQTALHDDEFMVKVFGAVYDCLPKPVYRFVKEEAFIQYCMERRQKLLVPSPAEEQDT